MAEPNIELVGLLRTVESKWGFAFRPRLSNLTLSTTVHDAYRNGTYVIPVTRDICLHGNPTAMQVAEAMRATMREFYEHEIDEAIVIEGMRPFDPHRKSRREETQAKLREIVY